MSWAVLLPPAAWFLSWGAVSFSHLVVTQDSCLVTHEKSDQKTDFSLKVALLEGKIAKLVWYAVQFHSGCNGTGGDGLVMGLLSLRPKFPVSWCVLSLIDL